MRMQFVRRPPYPLGALALLAATALPLPARAQAPMPALEQCAEIGAPADRLACYDKAMGRAPAPTAPPAYVENPAGGAPQSSSLLAPKDAALTVAGTAQAAQEPSSLMSRYWELEPQDKRGVFNFVGYKANYVLPLHLTSRINRAPQSPSQAVVELPNYKREEAKFQLSLRTKLAQDVGLDGADIWAAFTQQAMWQIWNGTDSKPFRNSDYEPELIYVVPTPAGLRKLPFDWQWRYTQLGVAHQSNGQSDPLSRSWNRVNLAAGFERGDWSLVARFLSRLNEKAATDNNPDLVAIAAAASSSWAGRTRSRRRSCSTGRR